MYRQQNPLTTIITLSIGTDKPKQTVDPDQMQQNVASDQDLHLCYLSSNILNTSAGSGSDHFKF